MKEVKDYLKKIIFLILIISFTIKPVLAVTYYFYHDPNNYSGTIEDIKIGDVISPGDVLNFKNWRDCDDYRCMTSKLVINYFEEAVDESTYYYDYIQSNVYTDEIDEFPDEIDVVQENNLTVKSIEQTGLNIPESKNGIPFSGWKVTYLRPSQYQYSVSVINLVPYYGYEHKIIEHPTNLDPSIEVTDQDHVSDYYYGKFDKTDGLKVHDWDNSYYDSEVNSDAYLETPSFITSTANKIIIPNLLNASEEDLDKLLSEYDIKFAGYFELNDDDDISITYDSLSRYYYYYYEIALYDVSSENSNLKSAYDYLIDEYGYEPDWLSEELLEKLKSIKTNVPLIDFDDDLYEFIEDDSYDEVAYNLYDIHHTLNLNKLKLKSGLYKIYIYTDFDDIDEDYLNEINENSNTDYKKSDLYRSFTFNGFKVFTMDNFEWLNKDNDEDTSSRTIAAKYIVPEKSYLIRAKYQDGYTLTSKSFTAKEITTLSTISNQKSNSTIENKVTNPDTGDNILHSVIILVISLLSITSTMLYLRKIRNN